MCNVTLSVVTSTCISLTISKVVVPSACRAYWLDLRISTPNGYLWMHESYLSPIRCPRWCTRHVDCSKRSSVVIVWCLHAWRWVCLLLVYSVQALWECIFSSSGFSSSSSTTQRMTVAWLMNCLSSTHDSLLMNLQVLKKWPWWSLPACLHNWHIFVALGRFSHG